MSHELRPDVNALFRASALPTVTQAAEALSTDDHPFSQLERVAGVSSTRAAKRLGLSMRQYQRYKRGANVPYKVRLLVELGAIARPEADMVIDRRLQEWGASISP